jgi:hypothetical protein
MPSGLIQATGGNAVPLLPGRNDCSISEYGNRQCRIYWGVSFNSLLVSGVRYDIEGVPLSVNT